MPTDLTDLLERHGPSPSRPLDEDAVLRRARQLRRRRGVLASVSAVALLAVVGAAGLTLSSPARVELTDLADDAPAVDAPPPEDREPQPASATSGAVVVGEPRYREVVPGEPLEVTFRNTGDGEASTGTGYRLQRWDDGRWRSVSPHPPDVGAIVSPEPLYMLPSGGELVFTVDTGHLQPGWYRMVKTFGGAVRTPFEVVESLREPDSDPTGTPSASADVDPATVAAGQGTHLTVANDGDVDLLVAGRVIEVWQDGGWRHVRGGESPTFLEVDGELRRIGVAAMVGGIGPIVTPGEQHGTHINLTGLDPGRYRIVQQLQQPTRGHPQSAWPQITTVTEFRITEG